MLRLTIAACSGICQIGCMKILLSASMFALIAAATPAGARQLTIDDVTMLSRVAAPVRS